MCNYFYLYYLFYSMYKQSYLLLQFTSGNFKEVITNEKKKTINENNQNLKPNDLEKKLNEERERNNLLNKELLELQNKYKLLNEENEKNKKEINKDINFINESTNKERKEVNELQKLQKQNSELQKQNSELQKQNSELQKQNSEFQKQNSELQKLIINPPDDNTIKILLPGETVLSVAFTSMDQKIHFNLPCKNTDLFVRIEEKLYNQYPDYIDKNAYFLLEGKLIKRFRTLKENNIKSGSSIVLYYD